MRRVNILELWDVRRQLAAYLPHSALVHGTLDMGLKFGLLEQRRTSIYVPRGNSPASLVAATPALNTKCIQSVSVFWDTPEEDPGEVASCLANIPDLDWTKSTFISISSSAIIDKLEEMLLAGKLGQAEMKMKRVDMSRLWKLNYDQIPNHTSVDGFTVDRLKPEDIPSITGPWPWKWTETDADLASHIQSVPSAAVRSSSTGELVAWAYLYNNGMIGNMSTVPHLRGYGLQYLMLSHLKQQSQQAELFPWAAIKVTNEESTAFFKKVGSSDCGLIEAAFILTKGTEITDIIAS